MILQTFRDLEQRWRERIPKDTTTMRGVMPERWAHLEACTDELAAVREALEQQLRTCAHELALDIEFAIDVTESTHSRLARLERLILAALVAKEPT